jgi:hypothetical protein
VCGSQVDGVRHYPFGRGSTEEDGTIFGQACPLVQFPISPFTNTANDEGVPFCLQRPESAQQELSAFEALGDILTGELMKYQYGQREGDDFGMVAFGQGEEPFDLSTVTMTKSADGAVLNVRLFSDTGATQKRVSPARLRSRDPKTGEEIPDSPFLEEANSSDTSLHSDSAVTVHKTGGKKSPSLIPTKVARRGRYGFAVEWADGATIIYSMFSIARAAGGTLNK